MRRVDGVKVDYLAAQPFGKRSYFAPNGPTQLSEQALIVLEDRGAFQADDEGSIPFTRSSLFRYLGTCGRFTQAHGWTEAHAFLSVFGIPLEPHYKLAPATGIDVVVDRAFRLRHAAEEP